MQRVGIGGVIITEVAPPDTYGECAISMSRFKFKGDLKDVSLPLEYGKQVDALRKKYREYLWDGEFRNTLGPRS
jgi:hypothetical protein